MASSSIKVVIVNWTALNTPLPLVPQGEQDADAIAAIRQLTQEVTDGTIRSDYYVAELAKILGRKTENVTSLLLGISKTNEDVRYIIKNLSRHGVTFSLVVHDRQRILAEEMLRQATGIHGHSEAPARASKGALSQDSPVFYAVMAITLSMQPEEILYVDSVEANLAAASATGLHTLCFEDYPKLRQALYRMNLI